MRLCAKIEIFQIIRRFLKDNPQGVLEILGPTASGKTGLSIEVAKYINDRRSTIDDQSIVDSRVEILSVDSRQVYRECDIASAKITEAEMAGIPHHGLNLLNPDQEYNVYQFQQYAFETIEAIKSRGNVPILCGGTMLWLDAVSENYKFSEEQAPPLDKKGAGGRFIKSTQKKPPRYSFLKIGLHWDREKLYERINQRARDQFENGLIEETKALLNRYQISDIPAKDGAGRYQKTPHGKPVLHPNFATSFGYLELEAYLQGRLTYAEALRKNQQRNRNYAKRQLTWWRGREDIIWIDMNQ